ncbi:MAG: TadE family protein [Bryobacteraceae bacterium]
MFVESSLVFTALVFMLLGIFDFGQFLFIHQALVERARYAARWGAINDPTNTTSIRNMVMYNQSGNPDGSTQPYFGLTTSNVQVSTLGGGSPDYRLKVLITNYPSG